MRRNSSWLLLVAAALLFLGARSGGSDGTSPNREGLNVPLDNGIVLSVHDAETDDIRAEMLSQDIRKWKKENDVAIYVVDKDDTSLDGQYKLTKDFAEERVSAPYLAGRLNNFGFVAKTPEDAADILKILKNPAKASVE